MSNRKALEGIWTPTASILCFECHGRKFPSRYTSEEKWKIAIEPYELEYNNGITKCMRCESDVQVPYDIAEENNLVLALQAKGIDAQMDQTGGMCSAAFVESSPDDGADHFLITYDETFLVGSYDEEGVPYGSEMDYGGIYVGNAMEVIQFFIDNKNRVRGIEK